jgi:NDP-sugar pyrophosphorylase family protein
MNAMVLAAGRGTRLGTLGRAVAKVMVDVGREPLLARQLRYLAREGFTRVVVNTHHLADQIAAFVAAYAGPLEVVCSHEHNLLGTAGGVRKALPLLGPAAFAVLYGDVLVDESIAPVVATHRASRAAATLAVYRASDATGKGVVELAGDGRVTTFVEKPATQQGPAYINAGIYIIDPGLVAALPIDAPTDFAADVFPAALRAGEVLVGHVLANPVIDVGTLDGLALARAQVGEGRRLAERSR